MHFGERAQAVWLIIMLSDPVSPGGLGSGAMSGTAVDFSNFSKIRLWGGRGDPID